MNDTNADRGHSLSPHFSLAEMTRTEVRDLDNTPDDIVLAHLKVTAHRMGAVRELLGHSIQVTSGYRSPMVNRRVGGSKTSAHMLGYAVDFVCPEFGTPKQICEKIAASGIKYDQLIFEHGWAHISFSPDQRMALLTAHFGPGGTTYTTGIA